MWYVGIVLIIIIFILFLRSTSGNHDTNPQRENHEPEFRPMPKPGPNITRRHDNFRIVRPRYDYPNRMRPSREGNRIPNHRSDNISRSESSTSSHNGTPRGGGTGGSRGSMSNSNPSGGRR